jgi:hypothetical protein
MSSALRVVVLLYTDISVTEDPSASFKAQFKKEPIRYMEEEEDSCVWPSRVEKGKGPY